MKIKIFLGIGLCLIGCTLSQSCKEYNFDFKNGYQQGDSIPSDILTDTTMFVADRSMYAKARIYPGLVGDAVSRIQRDTSVTLDMSKDYVQAFAYRVASSPRPIYSTGLYAPAGENIRITVPEGVVGLTVQLGAHMDNNTGLAALRREPIIYTRKELFPGVNYVKNLFGGLVWIVNEIKKEQPVTLRFAGVVRTSDFILGVTDLEAWKRDVIANDVPWLELRSRHTVYTVPRSLLVRYIRQGRADGVAEALTQWNTNYRRDFYDWMGLTENAAEAHHRYPQLPERGVMDIHPRAGYAHAGNPWVMQQDEYWLETLIDPVRIQEEAWGTFHEVGHNYQQSSIWSWSDLGETTNNLFVFNGARNRGIMDRSTFHPAVAVDFPKAVAWAMSSGAKNFSDLPDDIKDSAPFFRITPFLQIFDKAVGRNGELGWDFFPFLYTNARNSTTSFGFDQAKKDYFYRQLCHFTGRDYARFFAAWGISVSGIARREIRNLYPPMDRAIWEYNPVTRQGGDNTLSPRYDLDRTSWVVTASTQYPEEGNGNGVVAALVDGNPNTFWMSHPNLGQSPHVLRVDMGELTPLKGVFYQARNAGSNIPRTLRIETSFNGTNWQLVTPESLTNAQNYTYDTTLEAFHLSEWDRSRKEFILRSVIEPRYIRFTFPSATSFSGSRFVGVAEIGAFFDN
ncbi:M60 family metallopeptidase [Sphingobacterium griseoflavum]|uniref:Carbohydrate-binding protein n=1 Tax=Sphingobacterium griseoflavum TaxID=1474952 RepID=A0ABQ3HQ99_9SPHI|nr:M60 family metallopeptidase [Sphingobacterium griseoflavum]GHE23391.1 carbohydrate-binding protein [Sphingobacterium griseoflavum]